MKQILRKIGQSFRHNILLKIAALVFAVLLWNYAITIVDASRLKTVADVPVRLTNDVQTLLQQRNMSLVTENGAGLPNVRVDLKVPRSEYVEADARTVQVTLDLSRVSQTGLQEVPLRATTQYGTVESITPATVTLNLEQTMKKTLPVKCVYTGTLGDNLWRGRETLNPSTLEVTGPATLVGKVAGARVIIDQSQLSIPFERAMDYELIDMNGDPVSHDLITLSESSVRVSMPLYPTKKVLIQTQDAYVGLEDGYYIEQFTLRPGATLTIAAEQEVLDRIPDTGVLIEPVDLSGVRDATVNRPVSFRDSANWKMYEPLQCYVEVKVSEERETRVFEQLRVRIEPEISGEIRYAQTRVRVEVNGPRTWVNGLTAADITVYVNTDGLLPGTYDLPVQLRFNTQIDRSRFQVLAPDIVQVTVEEAEPPDTR